jgi:colanic acid/amylovoran biosynthesis glycosyltransferase
MTVAYLVNQYPQTSQSFIRREIVGLEAVGVVVERFTLRRSDGNLADPADEAERNRTRVVLGVGAIGLAGAVIRELVTRPVRFFRALRLTIEVGNRSDRGLLRHFAYLAEACVLRKWLATCEAEHLHAHFGTNSTTVAMLCRELGGPSYSFTAHGPEEFDAIEGLSLGRKIERAKFIVAISSFGRAQLCRCCLLESWGKIRVVRCGVDGSFLNSSEAVSPPANESRQFACVGRLESQKGHLQLLEAVAALVKDGTEVQVVLVGDGSMRGVIEKRIAELGLQKNIRLAGWLSGAQVRSEILASRGLVLASFAEGLPVVIMEALALGRPVISTWVAGIPELVESGKCGWLVPAGDGMALAAAMREALEMDSSKLAAMGAEGRRRVIENHDSAVEARKLAELFKSGAEAR